ncbi:helix-turn-helix domain-containing protein [Acetobacterium wieringae]|uniref:Helix-turn-helix domain-containing protein n=1 Tax=Acetobacterium wieringae TaxID=52694 RepID=A0ABY6HBJ0_9FIRM|nr:helix-turn-helix transcriptional regulator [Acetobacterium wieringae]UYO61855.1 helix-turn-helix domain-containing protein [Acetobacterium wieringae]
MNENCKNILKMFRLRAGISQEEAASALSISIHTLYNYETYSNYSRKNMPPEEIILEMMDLYITDPDPVRRKMRQFHMGIMYLCETNQIFSSIFCGVKSRNLAEAFINYQMELEDVQIMEQQMRRVIVDDQIEDHETDVAGAFLKELLESTFANVEFAVSAMEKTVIPQKIAKKMQPKKHLIMNEGRSMHVENKRIFATWG